MGKVIKKKMPFSLIALTIWLRKANEKDYWLATLTSSENEDFLISPSAEDVPGELPSSSSSATGDGGLAGM